MGSIRPNGKGASSTCGIGAQTQVPNKSPPTLRSSGQPLSLQAPPPEPVQFGLAPYVMAIKITNRAMVLDPPLPSGRQHWLSRWLLPILPFEGREASATTANILGICPTRAIIVSTAVSSLPLSLVSCRSLHSSLAWILDLPKIQAARFDQAVTLGQAEVRCVRVGMGHFLLFCAFSPTGFLGGGNEMLWGWE